MNDQKILYTLIDREYNVKNTFDRSTALGWISGYYNRSGEKFTRSVLFSTLGPQGLGTVNLYINGSTDKDWTCKLTRQKVSLG